MKKIIYIVLIIFLSNSFFYSQNSYQADSLNTMLYGDIPESNKAVFFRNDTFFVNSSTHFLHKFFNFSSDEDSLVAVADTIFTKTTSVFVVDTLTNSTIKIYTQIVSFDWIKSIPYDSDFIAPPTTAYKSSSGRWDDCTYFGYVYGISRVCFAIMVCDLPDDDTYTWCSGVRYTKIYEDNFEGSTIDLDHWRVGYDWGLSNTRGTAANTALKRNVEVSNGTLKLKTQAEGTGPLTDSDGATYPSTPFSDGVITSALSYGFGKYSMRAKVPQSVGVNPAYWLMSDNFEIDGFEFFNMNRADAPQMTIYSDFNTSLMNGPCYNTTVDGTVNYWGYNGRNRIFAQTAHKNNIWNNLPDLADGNWYIFTLVHDPNYITWFIETDDHQQAWRLTYPYVQQQNQSNVDPNLNCSCTGCVVQVNANFPAQNNGNVKFIINNSSSTSGNFITGNASQTGPYIGTTSVMEIDWVKIYVPDACWSDATENSGFFRATDHINRNHLTGNNVTLGGNGDSNPYEIKYVPYDENDQENSSPRTYCAARANTELALLDGFSVDENALFEGSISFQGGNGGVPADCNNQTYWPQIYRTANNQSPEKTIEGIEKIINSKNVVLYPNPASDYLNITSKKQINKVEIYNSIGQLVLSESRAKEKIDVNSLIKGMHVIKVYFENDVVISKFIKE